MAFLTLDQCPHCRTRKVAARLLGEQPHREDPTEVTGVFLCQKCNKAVGMTFSRGFSMTQPLSQYTGDIIDTDIYVLEIYPKVPEPFCPAHLPENIRRFFLQSASSLEQGNHDAAGAMCRKTLDTATKHLAPEHKGEDLFKRINLLADANRITAGLKEWAHAIRIGGNDASHDEDPFTEDEAQELHSFTELFLIYVYDLPGMLTERRKKKDGDETGA